MVHFLKASDIILINRMTISRHGGKYEPPANILNGESIDYLIEIVEANLYGKPLYPEISDKAALYMYSIVSNHIFHDGNKRTGLQAALLFLKLNGYKLKGKLVAVKYNDKRIPKEGNSVTEILINFTLELASGYLSQEACTAWFEKNIKKISS